MTATFPRADRCRLTSFHARDGQHVAADALPLAAGAGSPRSPASRRLQRRRPRFTVRGACLVWWWEVSAEARHGAADRSVPGLARGGNRSPARSCSSRSPTWPRPRRWPSRSSSGPTSPAGPALSVIFALVGACLLGGHLDRPAGQALAVGGRLLHLRRPRAPPGRGLPGRLGLRRSWSRWCGAAAVPDLRQRGRRHPRAGVRLELATSGGWVAALAAARDRSPPARLVRGCGLSTGRKYHPGPVRDPGVRRPGRATLIVKAGDANTLSVLRHAGSPTSRASPACRG